MKPITATLGGIHAGLLACTTACSDDTRDAHVAWTDEELALIGSLSPIGALPPSEGNAYGDVRPAAELGRRIFFDERFSRNGEVSCSRCHMPERYFSDGRALAFGASEGTRNTPTLLGGPWFGFFGWDGRSDSLWSQSLKALTDEAEHGLSPSSVTALVAEHYRSEYESIFGALPKSDDDAEANELVFVNVGKALEAYMRRLVPGRAPFDDYVAALLSGDPRGGEHLSPAAQRGLRTFLREGCVSCHHGPMLSDGEFHNLGLPPSVGTSDRDEGRRRGAHEVVQSPHRCGGRFSNTEHCDALRFLNPDFSDYEGAFRTPTLRNVSKTGPYMHAGQFATLEAVVEFYRFLPPTWQIGRRDPQLRPLGRALDTRDMVAFLRTLTGGLPDEHWLRAPDIGDDCHGALAEQHP